jgi:multiple sugar transport system permease protein
MNKRQSSSLPYVFLLPPLLILAVLALVPTVGAIYLALRDRMLQYADSHFVWFENFSRLAADRRFLNAIKVSAQWEAVTVLGTLVVGVLLAVWLFEKTSPRTRNLLSVLLIIPVLLPRVSAAFLWKFMFSPLLGIVSWLLGFVGLGNIAFLSDPGLALLAVAFVDVWQWGLFFAVIVLKLLETLPPEPLEAARIDYARSWEVYALVALPMLRAPLVSLALIKMIESLRSFDLIYVMTKGGPGIATEAIFPTPRRWRS